MRALALVAALSGVAHADLKSETTATALSGVGAGVSGALVVSSFVFGTGNDDFNRPLLFTGMISSIVTPSLGQLYAGEYLTVGMGLRAGAAGLATLALLTQEEDVTCDDGRRACKDLKGAGLALMGLAAIAYIGGVAYDVQDAGDAAKRANGMTISLVPTGSGAALVGRF